MLITKMATHVGIIIRLNTSYVNVNLVAYKFTSHFSNCLNTSYVNVNPTKATYVKEIKASLNTSHINVNHEIRFRRLQNRKV